MTNLTLTQKNDSNFEIQTTKSKYLMDINEISPVEYFVSSAAACSAVDIVELPKAAGKIMNNLEIKISYERNETAPKKLNVLHLHYHFNSDADDNTAKKWVMSSMETYCSTINSLRSNVKILYSITHNKALIADNTAIISGTSQANFTNNLNAASIGSCLV